jgi:hypothetical protein
VISGIVVLQRILVTLVTLTVVTGESLDLLNFQLGSLSEDDNPSTAFAEAEESSPSSSYDKSSSGPINLYDTDDGLSGSGVGLSSFSSQDEGPAGPLNYPESSSSSGKGRKPAKKYPNQNDIFSDFGGKFFLAKLKKLKKKLKKLIRVSIFY